MARIGDFDIYEGECYMAFYRSGNGHLTSTPSDEESVDSIRRLIDRRNEQARYCGESQESFCIVRRVWNKIFYPDGTFREAHETQTTVELYPTEQIN